MNQPLSGAHRSAHLTNDELLDHIYGLGESSIPHLRDCEECSSRFQALERRRAEAALPTAASAGANGAVSNEFLAAQRRAIYSRFGEAPAAGLHWAPAALAVAFLLVMGVFLARPHAVNRAVRPAAPALAVDLSQEQLFSDLYSMEESVEPRAAAPIHALFEGSDGNAVEQ
jgi:hypothetical protein